MKASVTEELRPLKMEGFHTEVLGLIFVFDYVNCVNRYIQGGASIVELRPHAKMPVTRFGATKANFRNFSKIFHPHHPGRAHADPTL